MAELTDKVVCSVCLSDLKHSKILDVDFTAIDDHFTCRSCQRDTAIPEDDTDNLLTKSDADALKCEEKSTEENCLEDSKIAFPEDKDVSSNAVRSSEVPRSGENVIEENQKDSISNTTTFTADPRSGENIIEETQTRFLEDSEENQTKFLEDSEDDRSNSSRFNEVPGRDQDVIAKNQTILLEDKDDSSEVLRCRENVIEGTTKLFLEDSKDSISNATTTTEVPRSGEDVTEESKKTFLEESVDASSKCSGFSRSGKTAKEDLIAQFKSNGEVSNSICTGCSEVPRCDDDEKEDSKTVFQQEVEIIRSKSTVSGCAETTVEALLEEGTKKISIKEEDYMEIQPSSDVAGSTENRKRKKIEESFNVVTKTRFLKKEDTEYSSDVAGSIKTETEESLKEVATTTSLKMEDTENVSGVPGSIKTRIEDSLKDVTETTSVSILSKPLIAPVEKSVVPTLERLDKLEQDISNDYSKNTEITDGPCVRAKTEPEIDENLIHMQNEGSSVDTKLLQEQVSDGPCVGAGTDLLTNDNLSAMQTEGSSVDTKLLPEQLTDGPYAGAETGLQIADNLRHMKKEGSSVDAKLLKEQLADEPYTGAETEFQTNENLSAMETEGSSVDTKLLPEQLTDGPYAGAETNDNLSAIETEGSSVDAKLPQEQTNSLAEIKTHGGLLQILDKVDISATGVEAEMMEVKFNADETCERGIWYYSKKILFDGIGWRVVVGRHARDNVFIGVCPSVAGKDRYKQCEVEYDIKLVNDECDSRSVRKHRTHTFTLWGVQGLFEFLPWHEVIDVNSGFVDNDNFFKIKVMINVTKFS